MRTAGPLGEHAVLQVEHDPSDRTEAGRLPDDEGQVPLGKFDDALRESYLDMADDVSMIRRNRAERRKKVTEQKPG